MTVRKVINGMQVQVPDDVKTVGDLKRHRPELRGDQIMAVKGSKAEPLNDDAQLSDGDELVSMPPIVKG